MSANTYSPLQADQLSRAKGYPYAIPDTSYVVDDGGWRVLSDNSWHARSADSLPVLALGSNRSPEQLARKYQAGFSKPISVSLAWMADFDVVYSAHITRYGSVPATLQHAPGTEVAVSVTWLNPQQLIRMHETESVGTNYDFGRLSGVQVRMQSGEMLTEAFAYISRRGNLARDGEPLAMAAAAARGRRWQALDQETVLEWVRQRLTPDQDLDSFVLAHTNHEDVRQERTARLSQDSISFTFRGFEPICDAYASKA